MKFALALLGLVVVVSGQIHNKDAISRRIVNGRQEDICDTPECIIAAGDILNRMDQNADPCQDFYQFACGGYVANTELEESESKTGIFYEVRDIVDEAVRGIIESDINPDDSMSVVNLKNLHIACLDTATIDASGYDRFIEILVDNDAPVGFPLLTEGWTADGFSWEKTSGDNSRYYLTDNLISYSVYLDAKDTTRNLIYFDQPGLILSRDVYLNTGDFAESIDAYKAFIMDAVNAVGAAMDGFTVDQDALAATADAVFNLEADLANIIVPPEDRRDNEELYNPTTVGDLKTDYPLIDWDTYFAFSFANTVAEVLDDSEEVVMVEPPYFEDFITLIPDLDQETVANYLYIRRLLSMAGEGPTELVDILFNFNSVLSGQSEPTPRWSSCVDKASSESKGFAYAVGTEYVKGFVDENVKPDSEALVEDLRVAFAELLDENEWMTDETKPRAQEKLDLIVALVAYDETIISNDGIDEFYDGAPVMTDNDHFSNMANIIDYSTGKFIDTLRETPDREEWITPAAVVNAFYAPDHNSISFPSGILQPPFFGSGYPRYLNYGGIGVVMGHEVTHGFDDQGSQFDGIGQLESWWTDEDREEFDNRAQCFIDQYSAYEVPEISDPDLDNINGELTQGENIADNGGLHESFRAYINSVAEQGPEPRLPGLEQYSPEQMFFLAYSQVWCEVATEESHINQLQTDPHSPGRFRVIGPLSNSEDFVREFSCTEVNQMNRGDEKCLLW